MPTPPGMVRSVSSPPAPVRTAPTAGGKPWGERAGEAAEPREGAVPPLLRRVCIGDADAVSDPGAVAAARVRGRGGAGGGRRGTHSELPTPVPWRSDLLAPRTPPALSLNVHVGAPPAYYESEGEGEERRRLEATPTPYSREEEREREGEQVGGKRKR
ncbi:hypothetical protein B0H14DRAFT_2823960 [Mycena olivaceomarginata]|nr:hypothetical protein B0H14DRAFT_2823960 [Mycena olivaceomarginata]